MNEKTLVCWRCAGRGWEVHGNDYGDNREDCPACREGDGKVSVEDLEREIARMRAVAYGWLRP